MLEPTQQASLGLPVVIVVILASIITVFVKRRYFSSISDIPGPFAASFSLLWQLWQIVKGHTEVATIEQHRKHGTFVRISHNEISISDVRAIREVLHSQMNKASWYKIFSMPDKRYINTMSETSHPEMVRKTKNVAAGYSLSNIIKGEPHIDKLLSLLSTQLDRLISNNEMVEFNKWFNFLAFDAVGEATFSRSFGFLEAGSDIGNSIANTFKMRLYVAFMGHFNRAHDLLLGNPLIAKLKLQPAMHTFDTCLATVKARSENKEEHRKDMIEEWQLRLKDHPERMGSNEILAAATANMGAGADTVSAVLQAVFYYLLRDRESLLLLREEIDQAQLSPIPAYSGTRDLPWLQACIKEAYRMHTPVGFGLPRVSPSPNGITVCDRHFAPGITLSVNPWVMHRTRSVFGADPDLYNARRWLREEAKVKEMEKCLIPFGAGYGQCPGRNLAHLEITKTVALLVRDYEWKQVEEGKDWKFETFFTAVPYGWPCTVNRRQDER